jgi:ribosome-binding protein aMBF1 (putative translation factor)
MPIRYKVNKNNRNERTIQRQTLLGNSADTWNYVGQHTFASYLKTERSRKGYSRHSLAVTAGMQEKRLLEIELGKEMPSFKDMQALSAILDIPESELMAAGHLSRE